MRKHYLIVFLALIAGHQTSLAESFGQWRITREDPAEITVKNAAEGLHTFSSAEDGVAVMEAEMRGDFVVTVRMNNPEELRGKLQAELETVHNFSIHSGGEGQRLHGLRLTRSGGVLGRQFSFDGLQWDYLQNSSDWRELPECVSVRLRLQASEPLDRASFTLTVERPSEVNPRTSWVGNSYPDRIRAVPVTMGAIHATPDGAVHTNGHFNESTSSFKIYSENGEYLGQHDTRGRSPHSGGWAITGDENRVYFTSNGHRRIYANHHDGRSAGLEAEIPGGSLITGLAVHGDTLYAADAMGDRILRFEAGTLRASGEIAIPSPNQIAIDRAGRLWVLHNENTHVMRMVESRLDRELDRFPEPLVAAYTLEGEALPMRIEGLEHPSALHYHAAGDVLMVAENGSKQQVLIFANLEENPEVVDRIGAPGGIFAPPAGKVRPGHLNGVQAISSAGSDAVYVVNAGSRPAFGSWHHADLRRFERVPGENGWRETWSLLGNHFVDMGMVDPETGDIVSKFEIYAMDHDAPSGEGWSYAAFTHNPFAFPHDPRLWERMYRVLGLIHRDGHKLLYLGSDNNHFLTVYRFDPEQHGEIAIPAALFSTRALPTGKWGHSGPQPVEAESQAAWLWRDDRGNGRMDEDEFVLLPDTHRVSSWEVASNGDIWQPSEEGFIVHRLTGFDENGVPRFEPGAEKVPYPDPIVSFWRNTGSRAQHDAERDILFVSGATVERRGFQGMFPRELIRVENASDPDKRHPVSRIVLPHDMERWPGPGERTRNLGGLHVAGDYVFAGSLKPAVFWVYDSRTGMLVDTFVPGAEIGAEMGDMDRGAVSLSAHQLNDDEYLVVAEEDFFLKLALFYWRPPEQKTPAERLPAPDLKAMPGTEGMNLWWQLPGKAVVDGFWIDRIDETGNRVRLTPEPLRGNVFTDREAPRDTFHAYVVTPVSDGEPGTSSPPRAASLSTSRAEFRGLDTETRGDWKDNYGTGGYFLFPDGHVSISLENGNLPGSTFPETVRSFFQRGVLSGRDLNRNVPDTARLELPGEDPSRRQNWAWRITGPSAEALRLATLDNRARDLSIYFLPSREPTRVEVLIHDADNEEVLDRREIELNTFDQGVFATWEVLGNLRVRFRLIEGTVSVCGFFLDDAEETNNP